MQLTLALSKRFPQYWFGAFLRADTDSRTGLADWLTEIGLAHVGGGVTMDRPSRQDAAQVRPKVYALANQALG